MSLVYVVTADQRGSRRAADAVPAILEQLAARATVRPFERTAGDEVQGLLDEATEVVDVVVDLVRAGDWWVGIGTGAIDTPLPDSARAGRGSAYVLARAAVERSKSEPQPICVEGEGAESAEAALWLLAALLGRRTEAGWEAVDAMTVHEHQVDGAAALGISPQAFSRRLAVAGWIEERRGRTLGAHLLEGER